MIIKVYSVYDNAAGAYLPPFTQQNDAMAIRIVQGMVNDGRSIFSQSPADFSVFYLGEYDDENGMFTQDAPPKMLAGCLSLVERSNDSRQMDAFDKDAALANLQRDIGHTDEVKN